MACCLVGRFQFPSALLLLHGSLSMPPNGLPDMSPTDFAFSLQKLCVNTLSLLLATAYPYTSVLGPIASPLHQYSQSFSSCLLLSFAPSLYPPPTLPPENHPAYQPEETSPCKYAPSLPSNPGAAGGFSVALYGKALQELLRPLQTLSLPHLTFAVNKP